MKAIAGVVVPDSATARAAEALARERSPWMLYAHAKRSYLWAALLARGERFDAEALFVAAVLHDIGLAPGYEDPVRPFEEVGADVAVGQVPDWEQPRRDNVHRAIVLHMATEIATSESAEVRLLDAGVTCDVRGKDLERVGAPEREEILRLLPRGSFKPEFAALMQREAERKPASAAAVLISHGMLDAIAASPFADTPTPPARA
jgi:HD domain